MKNVYKCALVGVATSMMGCTNYYRVTDPSSGRVYYTTALQQRGGGAATFKNAGTGNSVTVQNSEVETISKEKFESGKVAAAAPQQPAATAAPAQPAASTKPAEKANPFQ